MAIERLLKLLPILRDKLILSSEKKANVGAGSYTVDTDQRGFLWFNLAPVFNRFPVRRRSLRGFMPRAIVMCLVLVVMSAAKVFAAAVITVSGNLTAFASTYGTAPANKTFNVSGTGMTAGITVTAPAGFELSTAAGGPFTSSVLVGAAGTIASTTIYVRIAATTVAGNYNGLVVACTSPTATTKNSTIANSTVSKAAITLTASNQSKTYGSTFTFVLASSYTITAGSLKNADAITGMTFTCPGAAATGAAGTSTITPSAATGSGNFSTANYTITYGNGTMTVNKVVLTLTGASASNKVYDGTNVATITGGILAPIYNGDVVTASTGTFASSNVGTGIAVTVTLSGAGAGNYTLTQPGLVANISVAPLTITATGVNKPFNTALTNGAKATGFTSSGLVASQTIGTVTFTYGSGGAASDPIGTYTASITIAGAAGGTFTASNYAITYTPGDIVVAQATLTITAVNQTYTYGSVVVGTQSVTYSGWVGGDGVGNMIVLPVASTGATSTSGAGTYPITVSGAVAPSYYNVVYVDGTFTINKKAMIITISGPAKTSGFPISDITGSATYYNITGLVGTENVTSLDLDINPNTAQTAGQSYTVSGSNPTGAATGFDPNNYTVSYFNYSGTCGVGYTWTGNTSSAWNVATNWSPNGIPGTNDNVGIPSTGVSNQPAVTANTSINTLQFTGTTGNSSLTINSGVKLQILNGFINPLGVTATMIMGSNTAELNIGTQTSEGLISNAGTFKMSGGILSITYGLNYVLNSGTMILNGGNVYNIGGHSGQLAFDNSGTVYIGTSNSSCSLHILNSQSMINDASGSFYVGSTSSITFDDPASHDSHFTNANGGNFVFQSDQYGSATLGAIPQASGTNSFDGVFTVERYISAHRGYRLIASPVWSGTSGSNKVYSLNYVQNSAYITGTNPGGGFDKVSIGPTLYLYREDVPVSNASFISGNYQSINDLNSGYNAVPTYTFDVTSGSYSIPNTNGFLFFFRGNRASADVATETTTTFPATAATLSTDGYLNQGTLTFRDWYTPSSANLGRLNSDPAAQGFNLVANPYPSTIDWETYQTATSGTGIYAKNISDYVYELNPITQNYDTYEKGGLATNNGTRNIASGQGFFVLALNGAATLQLNESCKTNSLNTGANLLMGMPADQLAQLRTIRVQMAKDDINTDDMLIAFNDDAKANFDFAEDAPYKQGNGKISLASISADNTPLAINKLPFNNQGLTIRLKAGATADGTYTMNLKDIKGIPQLFAVWLKDNFTKDSVNLRATNSYTFSITKSDTNTFGSNRFALVIKQDPAYAYALIDFNAKKMPAERAVQVNWTTKNEENYTNFTVEKSIDNGVTFNVLGGVNAAGLGAYGFTDTHPVNGVNVYRLKQEDINNTISYSKMVPVAYSNLSNNLSKSNLNVFPNPSKGDLNLVVMNDLGKAPSYDIMITNSLGLVIKKGSTAQPNWRTSVSDLMPGTYLVRVYNNKDQSLVGSTKFVKL